MQDLKERKAGIPDIEDISKQKWEILLDRFTSDMDPWDIDIVRLAERYRDYIKKSKKFDFELPARIILICSILLRMKANFLEDEEEFEEIEEEVEDFEEIPLDLEEMEEEEEPDLFIPDMELPVKKKPNRKVTLDELKDALEKAIKIEEKREERQDKREENYGIEIDKKSINSRLNGLMDKLKSIYSNNKDKVKFSQVLNKKDKREKIEKFVQVLHLENDEKVKCMQPEFLGEILIELEKELKENN